MSLIEQIKLLTDKQLPKHIAIIMDGNGRWAKSQGLERVHGHQQGVLSVRSTIEGAGEAGIRFLTLYAFSTENWNRPKFEIDALIALLVQTIHLEKENLMKNRVRLQTIGDIASLPAHCQEQLSQITRDTRDNTGLTVILALSYSGRWELAHALKNMIRDINEGTLCPEQISQEKIPHYLCTRDMPDPDILIRTGGDYRISNFLLWQIAYTELFFVPAMWPDFRKEHLWNIILDFSKRQRRFGKTGEQVEHEI
ncbi:MAG: isoprenyl transferase [Bacteroidales bacterium]|nr:isoprenyl transferase [Bacteroidales bacterium]